MALDFSRRELSRHERMDAPDCDLPTLRRTYARFAVLNTLVAGWRRVYRRDFRPHLAAGLPMTLLDIGCGGGDVPRHLAAWARHDGFHLQVTAIDADPRAIAYATGRPTPRGVTFRQALSGDLVREGQHFDFVTSNHLLHHLTDTELGELLHDSERLGRIKVVHNDLVRSPLAYTLFGAVAPFFPGTFIREDGRLSIRRSYTTAELAALAPDGWRTRPLFPFRHLLIRDGAQAWPHA